MAEKEERILIEQENDHCAKCQSYPNCDNCDYWFKSMTRTEVIERMAKAICNMGDEETWGRVDDNYKHYCTAQAEWALNALLEGK